jgi:hypothetical protein
MLVQKIREADTSNYVSRKGALFFSSHVQKFHTFIEYKSTAHIS